MADFEWISALVDLTRDAAVTLTQRGQDVLARAGRRHSGSQAEVFLVETASRMQEWSEGLPENQVFSRAHGMGLRLIDQGRVGFRHTNRWDDAAMDEMISGAGDAARWTEADPNLELPSTPRLPSNEALELVDSTLSGDNFDQHAAFLSTIEADVKKRDPRLSKVLRAAYGEGEATEALVNTRGLAGEFSSTHASFSIACVAVEGNETQVGYGFQVARHHADLDVRTVTERAVQHTLALLGGRQLPSGQYDLVLDPWIAAEMLELLAGALRADQVLKGKSFLAGKVGARVAAAGLTLIDDGRRRRGLGSSPFDGEGCPTQTTILVKDGILESFLYDSLSARKMKRRSTGNAVRGSYKGAPEPGTTNFYLQPGTLSPEAIVAGVRSGIYVRNVMGLHTVDTVSGDYSLGLSGEHIENGRRTHAVRGITMAGNLMDLLKSVEGIGSDLMFAGSTGAPTVCVRNVSVGGT